MEKLPKFNQKPPQERLTWEELQSMSERELETRIAFTEQAIEVTHTQIETSRTQLEKLNKIRVSLLAESSRRIQMKLQKLLKEPK